jgi:hypothetical protein
MPTNDFWPDFQKPNAVNSPVFLLKERAAALPQKTNGLVFAELKPASTPDGHFWVGFDLCSPALGDYTYRLLEVTYPPQFFPVALTSAEGVQKAQTLDEFKTHLELVLRSPRTKQVVEAIMAQATALGAVEAST